MAETTMPAAEAEAVDVAENNSYELAFHVLPTVAEGEVSGVFDAIKNTITQSGAEIFDEEAPERFDLAYEIIKHYEGKNRKFTSAYFGWVRFKAAPEAIATVTEGIEENTSLLRHLLIKLTKVEEAHPFRFHEALASEKMVTEVGAVLEASATEEAAKSEESTEAKAETEEAGEADKAEIDKALDKSEV